MSEQITHEGIDSIRALGESLRLVRYGEVCVLEVADLGGTYWPDAMLPTDTFRALVRAISDLGGDEIAELLGQSLD